MAEWFHLRNDLWRAPRSEGVYALADRNMKVQYIGRADDLHARIQQHPDPQNPYLLRAGITYFAFLQTANSEVVEARLIKQHNPPCNRV